MNSRSTIGGGVVGSGSSGRSASMGSGANPVDRIAKKLDQDFVINLEVQMLEFGNSFVTPFAFTKGGIASTRNVLSAQKHAADVKYVSLSDFSFKDSINKNYITLNFVTTSLGYLSLSSNLVENQPWMTRKGAYYNLYQSSNEIKSSNQAGVNLLQSNININDINYQSLFGNFTGRNYFALFAKDEQGEDIDGLHYTANTNIVPYNSSSLISAPNDNINCAQIDSDGNVYIGGKFLTFAGPEPTGSIIPGTGVGSTSTGTGYLIGDIFTINGGDNNATGQVTATGSGGRVTSFNLLNSGSSYTIGQKSTTTLSGVGVGTYVYVYAINSTDTTRYICKTNTNLVIDNSFTSSLNGEVTSIFVNSSSVYIAGSFTTVNGITRTGLAALDKSNGNLLSFSAGVSGGSISSITGSGGVIYIGGSFTTISGSSRNRLAALDSNSGNVLPWNPNAGNTVYSVLLSGSNVYVGGTFTTLSGSTRNRVGCVDSTTAQLTDWNPSISTGSYARKLMISGSYIYIAGSYSTISGSSRGSFSIVDKDSGQLSPLNFFSASFIRDFNINNNFIFIGGSFSSFSSSFSGVKSTSRMAIINLLNYSGTSVSSSPSSEIRVLLPYNVSNLFVGGQSSAFTNTFSYKLYTSSSINNFK